MYKLDLVTDDALWDLYLNSSEQSSIFLASRYLKSVGLDKNRAILTRDGIPKLGALISGEKDSWKYLYATYQGLFFIETYQDNYSGDISRIRDLSAFVELAHQESNFMYYSLHPTIRDIRAFDWHAYDNQKTLNMKISAQYTGILDLRLYENYENYLNYIRPSRRQEMKKSEQMKYVIRAFSNLQIFYEIYSETISRNGLEFTDLMKMQMKSIIDNALKLEYGELKGLFLDDELISAVFILRDSNSFYYQFGATKEAYREKKGSTILLLDTIRNAFSLGISQVDFCGMNSPKRGEFKATFNARPNLYFQIDGFPKEI